MKKKLITLLGLVGALTTVGCATTRPPVDTSLPEPEPEISTTYQELVEQEVAFLDNVIVGPGVLMVGEVGSYAMGANSENICSVEEGSSPKGRFILNYNGGIAFGPEDLDDNECTIAIEATRPGTYALQGRFPGSGEKEIRVVDNSRDYNLLILEEQLTKIGQELNSFNNVAMNYVSLEMVTELDLDFDIVGILGDPNPTEEYCSQLQEENRDISDLLEVSNLFFDEVSNFYQANPEVRQVFSEQYETFTDWKDLHDSRADRLAGRMERNERYCQ